MEDTRAKMIERIQALINKAESTDFAEEAKTYMEKAQALLAKYALSDLDLKYAGDPQDTIKTVDVLVSDPNAPAKMRLLNYVAKVNGVKVVDGGKRRRADKNVDPTTCHHDELRVISTDSRSVHYMLVYLTGFEKDIDATVMLYTSFLLQIQREVKRENIPSYVNKHTFNSHFTHGFASAIYSRLNKAKRDADTEFVAEAKAEGRDMLPVLASRKEQVDKAFEQMYGGTLRRGRAGAMSGSTGGYSSGVAAGQRADVGNPRVGGRAALGSGR